MKMRPGISTTAGLVKSSFSKDKNREKRKKSEFTLKIIFIKIETDLLQANLTHIVSGLRPLFLEFPSSPETARLDTHILKEAPR